MTIQPQGSNITVRMKYLREPGRVLIPDDKKAGQQALLPYGEVQEVGPDVATVVKGDKVIVLPNNYTGFIDPDAPDDPSRCILLCNEKSVMAKYVGDLAVPASIAIN